MALSQEAINGWAEEASYRNTAVETLQAALLEATGKAHADHHRKLKQRELVEAIIAHPDQYEASREPAKVLSAIESEIAEKQAELSLLESASEIGLVEK